MSCCDQAAEYLIDALGGESVTKKVVGGTKWWQIRGVNGCGIISNRPRKELIHGYSSVDGEWIVAKKDWEEAKKRAKSKERRDKSKERREQERKKSAPQPAASDSASTDDTSESGYTPEMDEQRCILYFHGGKLHPALSPRVTRLLIGPSSCLLRRGVLLRERGPGAVQHPAVRSKDQWPCIR